MAGLSPRLLRSAKVEIYGCDGSYWCVHGQGAGEQGVYMAMGQVQGLFEAPVRTAWVSAAHESGGTMKGMWHEVRDMSLGFHVVDQHIATGAYPEIESAFRQAFDYREDQWDWDAELARIAYTTEKSKTRSIDAQMYQAQDFNPGTDPNISGYGNPIVPLRAGQPMYYEKDVVTKWSTTGSSGSGTIKISNPTDQPMMHKWIVTRGSWTLPDVSWSGRKGFRKPGIDKRSRRDDRNRKILMPTIGVLEGGATVDLDPKKLMVRDAAGTNLLGRMPVPGRFFTYLVPPYTPETELPVSVTGAPAGGAMVQCVQPRRWSRPQGLELAA